MLLNSETLVYIDKEGGSIVGWEYDIAGDEFRLALSEQFAIIFKDNDLIAQLPLTKEERLNYEVILELANEVIEKWYFEHYKESIESWNWKSFKKYASSFEEGNIEFLYENDEVVGRCFIGTVFNLAPSGKYYTAWANSNANNIDVILDQIYYDVLDVVADENGMWIENGKGDVCDLFACCMVEEEATVEI